MDAAIARITTEYATKVKAKPYSVPLGMALLGCFKSPDMLAPLHIPSFVSMLRIARGRTGYSRKDTAGRRKENAEQVLPCLSALHLTAICAPGESWHEVSSEGSGTNSCIFYSQSVVLEGLHD